MKATAVRKYLTPEEVKKLQTAAARIGRHGKGCPHDPHGVRARPACCRTDRLEMGRRAPGRRTLEVHRLKGSKDSTHPLTTDVILALKKLPGDRTGYVFTSERDDATPVTANGFGKIVRRAGEAAGFEFVTHPHQLRHGCGYKLANEGKDTRSIQAYLGHSNIRHTVTYTAMSPTRFKNFWTD